MGKLAIYTVAAIVVACCSPAMPEQPCDIAYDCPSNRYEPVCGTDGKTYHNGCYMVASTCSQVDVAYEGECVQTTTDDPCGQPRPCPDNLRPVCGSDGVTYPNLCELESSTCGIDVTVEHEGACVATIDDVPCDRITMCPAIYSPLCGSDGVTYSNNCVMKARTCGTDVTVVHNGACVGTTTAVPCDSRRRCPALYGPVCGSDGVTYDNDCFLETRTCGTGVTVRHYGSC